MENYLVCEDSTAVVKSACLGRVSLPSVSVQVSNLSGFIVQRGLVMFGDWAKDRPKFSNTGSWSLPMSGPVLTPSGREKIPPPAARSRVAPVPLYGSSLVHRPGGVRRLIAGFCSRWLARLRPVALEPEARSSGSQSGW